MNDSELQGALRAMGWPIGVDGRIGPMTRQAIHDFQAGWIPAPGRRPLATDGRAGPETQWAMAFVLDHDLLMSRFFRFAEFRSKGNGWIKISRHQAWCMDRYREAFGPTSIISGYRDPAHNRRVGGATRSRHPLADACDVKPVATVARVRALGLFTGIGYNASSGRVAHVDTRPGDPRRPTTWRYGR